MLREYEGRLIMPTLGVLGRGAIRIVEDPEEIIAMLMPASAQYQASRRRARGDANWDAPLRKARNEVLSIYPMTTLIPRPWREAALSGYKIIPSWNEAQVLNAAAQLREMGLSAPHLTGPRPTYFLSLEGQRKLIEMMPWVKACPKKRWANVIALFRDALPLVSDKTKFWLPASFEIRDDSAETVFVNPRFAEKLTAWIESADVDDRPWWLPTDPTEDQDAEENEFPWRAASSTPKIEAAPLRTGDKLAGTGFKGTVRIKDIPTDISFGKPKADYAPMIESAAKALGGRVPVARMPQLASMCHVGRLGYAGLQVLRGYQPRALLHALDGNILRELDLLAQVQVSDPSN